MPTSMTTAPVALYRDPEIYERERTAIFSMTWQFFGLEADLTRPGDYLFEVLAGYPLLVLRDEGGGLRGYHNLCRHRAGPLVGEPRGRRHGELVCRFHGWRYGYDGRLIAPTGFGSPTDFDASAFGLLPIRVEAWRGMIFVNLHLEAAGLAEGLAPLDARLGTQPRRPARLRDRHPVHCNWKVYVENYLDGYHASGFPSGVGPGEGAAVPGDPASHGSFLVESDGNLWSWTWPNFGLSVRRGVMMVEHIRPEGPDRTVIEHLFLHESEDPRVEAAIHNSEKMVEEDAWVSARVQENLDAGVFRNGVLSSGSDGLVGWFQQSVIRTLEHMDCESAPPPP